MAPVAHDSVCHADGLLYVHALHTLYAIEPTTGKTAWSWKPGRRDEGQLLASPTVDQGKLFIGDQSGQFWCLDARTGKPIWSQVPSDQQLPIAATAVVSHRLVVIATRDGFVVAYDLENGREMWRQQLDGPVGSELLLLGKSVAVRTFWSVYLLAPRDGQIEARWHWRGRYTRQMVTTKNALLVVTQRAPGSMTMAPTSVLLASVTSDDGPRLIGLDRDGERFQVPCPRTLVGLRWSPETGLFYESRLDGLGILDGSSGQRLFDLEPPEELASAQCGLPDARDDMLYVLGIRGVVRAVRHPQRSRRSRMAVRNGS
jgi:hypothetical protein